MKLKQVLKKHNVTATVISLVERAETRQETVQSLIDFGLDVEVIESDPRDYAENYGNAFCNSQASAKAIELALEKKTNLLVCEDDIYFSKHFGVYANWAAEKDEITYFYAHDKVDKMSYLYDRDTKNLIKANQGVALKRLYKLWTTRFLPFTQCVYIPHRHLEAFNLDSIREGLQSFDLWLADYIRSNKVTPFIALPHPVQHKNIRLGKENTEGQEWKRSMSFVETDRYVPEIQFDTD